jgi:hypothetical protein
MQTYRLLASRDRDMVFATDYEILFDRLGDELRSAPTPAPHLFANIIASACTRIPVLSKAGKATRIGQLIEVGAWTEAALALIELELPRWRLRRLVFENGEWFCSLSRQPNVPASIDDSVDAVHEVLPLAILRAFVEARRLRGIEDKIDSVVPQLRQTEELKICCDNFA